jgi:hypothetical protein
MKSLIRSKLIFSFVATLISTPFLSAPLSATPLSLWDSTWTQIADDDGVWASGYVGPGYGGQEFDAEYLYYSISGTQLSIGLQTGFDVIDGMQTYDGKDYYAGDLALSLDGIPGYEFGVDFGFFTMNYDQAHYSGSTYDPAMIDTGSGTGIDTAGIYSSASWDNGVYQGYQISNPFALNGGSIVAGSNFSQSSGVDGSSYYRIVSFDLASLGVDISGPLSLDAHWTMSCGNDNINGSFSVPEPGILLLLATGLIGTLVVTSLKRRNVV